MRVDADTPADAVDAVKRARGNVNIISISAVRRPSVNYAEDSMVAGGNASFACDGMPYRPSNVSNGGRSVAS